MRLIYLLFNHFGQVTYDTSTIKYGRSMNYTKLQLALVSIRFKFWRQFLDLILILKFFVFFIQWFIRKLSVHNNRRTTQIRSIKCGGYDQWSQIISQGLNLGPLINKYNQRLI